MTLEIYEQNGVKTPEEKGGNIGKNCGGFA